MKKQKTKHIKERSAADRKRCWEQELAASEARLKQLHNVKILHGILENLGHALAAIPCPPKISFKIAPLVDRCWELAAIKSNIKAAKHEIKRARKEMRQHRKPV